MERPRTGHEVDRLVHPFAHGGEEALYLRLQTSDCVGLQRACEHSGPLCDEGHAHPVLQVVVDLLALDRFEHAAVEVHVLGQVNLALTLGHAR